MEVPEGSARLVGREEEIGRLDRALERGARECAIVAIDGEPGIGKTAMLTELARRADKRRFLVLDGRASEVESDLPFAVLIDALDDYLGSVNPRVLAPGDPVGRAELARIFPSLAELAEPGAGIQEERFRSHHAVRAMLTGLAAKRPVLLALDDLHWADQASLELVSHLLRHPPRAPLLVAFSFRSARAPAQLIPELTELERGERIEWIDLAPLSEQEAQALIGPGLDDATRDALFRVSGGNPFYLEQLSRARSGPVVVEEPVAVGEVPVAVLAAIGAELEGADANAGLLLRGGAVIGESFDLDLAAGAAGVEVTTAMASLDELLRLDLIRNTEAPRRFRFRHPIVRQAVYDSAPQGWLLEAHARAAVALATQGASPTARAPHVERSAVAGDDRAVAVLTAAGESASARAPAAAAHWYAAALRLVPDGDASRRLGLLVPRARALAACGRYEDSLRDLEKILALLPADDPTTRARVIASTAKVKQLVGRHGEAHRELVGALEELDDPRSPEATTLKLELAADTFFAGELEAFERWVTAALDDARGRDDRATIAAATGLLSAAQYMRDDTAGARATLDRALASIAELSDDELAEHLNAHTWTGLGAVYLERLEQAIALLDRTIRVALAAGRGNLPALMRITQALAHICRGHLDHASNRLADAVEASILTNNQVFLSWSLSLQSWARLIGGDVAAAQRIADAALAAGLGDDPLAATAVCYLAEVGIAGGDAERARNRILEHAGGPQLTRLERGFKSRGYELLARAELEVGDVSAARAWAARATAAAEGLGIDGRTSDALRAVALVALETGDLQTARRSAAEAAVAAERGGLLIDAARGRIIAGRALAAAGDDDAARRELEAATEALTPLGAGHYRDQASRELRRLGVRVARPERATAVDGGGLATLSTREREIAELVAAGRRNREVAESLFLSVRTVEGHLGRIFRKLEVSSRTQLAARIEAERD